MPYGDHTVPEYEEDDNPLEGLNENEFEEAEPSPKKKMTPEERDIEQNWLDATEFWDDKPRHA
jgi:hypothetical protein